MPGFTGGPRPGKALFIAETVWSWARAWYLLISMACKETVTDWAQYVWTNPMKIAREYERRHGRVPVAAVDLQVLVDVLEGRRGPVKIEQGPARSV